MKYNQPTDSAPGVGLRRSWLALALTALVHAAVAAGLGAQGALPSRAAVVGPALADGKSMHVLQVSLLSAADGTGSPSDDELRLSPELSRRDLLAPSAPLVSAPDVPDQRDSVRSASDASLGRIDFLSQDALDQAPVPRSSPDDRVLDEAHKSGLPIRVRIFIRADGLVWDVQRLLVAPGDEETADLVVQMFRKTAFIPGRRAGHDVASYIDVELALEPAARPVAQE